jgi:D-alanyl-lipoteichoic acid acyltransferase DltB (MBOAT superfamily)
MSFTETPFVILLVVVFGLWIVFRQQYKLRVAVLLVGSLAFYGYRFQWLLLLLLAYCVINWLVGLWIATNRKPKWALFLGVSFNLGVLAYWKYTPLLLQTLARILLAVDWPAPSVPEGWVIPFGISFYAFCGISYMVDVYRGITPAERNFFLYTLAATFFPHLVAGPILRPDDFLTKLQRNTMPDRAEAPLEALQLLARGFFKKMVIADRLALAIDPFFAHVADASTAGVWSLPYVYLYAFQIYFDFSGYTDIARGLGLMFGFRWPENFNQPYLATSVQEFWRRWHMTLSRFLRDYLYIPLGGSRHGAWRTNVNLMVTMLLGGLWHGASWSFLLWGGLHGLFLIVNRQWDQSWVGQRFAKLNGLAGWMWRGLCVGLTFQAVCLAWVFFRLTAYDQALRCVWQWFVFDAEKMWVGSIADRSLWVLLFGYGLVVMMLSRIRFGSDGTQRQPFRAGLAWGFGVAVLLLAILLMPGGEKPPFIYFQF